MMRVVGWGVLEVVVMSDRCADNRGRGWRVVLMVVRYGGRECDEGSGVGNARGGGHE